MPKLSEDQLQLAQEQMDAPPSTICLECGWAGEEQDKCPHCWADLERGNE